MTDLLKISSPEAGILHISLNRIEQRNALSHALLTDLLQILKEAKDDNTVRALLLTGEGKAFCAGADIKQLVSLKGPDGVKFARFGQQVCSSLETLGKPSIAAIQGYAFGGGCELAMSATLRIATEDAYFGQPEIKLGVIPGFGGTQRLARLVGKGRALDLCLTGRRFSAQDAYAWGLVNEITSPEKLYNRALELLKDLIKLGPIAMQSIITVINSGYNLTLDEALEFEAAYFGLCCTTADKTEGVNAFLEKREAVFSGA